MRKILLIITIILSQSSYSQNISFEEIVNLRSKSIGYIDDILLEKEWELIDSEYEDQAGYRQIVYGYNLNHFDLLNTEYLLVFEISNNIENNKITFQTSDKKVYLEYLNNIKSKGKLFHSRIEDKNVVKFYRNNFANFKVITDTEITDNGLKTKYIIIIFSLTSH
ncbi:hypothetical protein OBJ95_06600 [Empedobacter falsenii]